MLYSDFTAVITDDIIDIVADKLFEAGSKPVIAYRTEDPTYLINYLFTCYRQENKKVHRLHIRKFEKDKPTRLNFYVHIFNPTVGCPLYNALLDRILLFKLNQIL